jgi:hypothetical protein
MLFNIPPSNQNPAFPLLNSYVNLNGSDLEGCGKNLFPIYTRILFNIPPSKQNTALPFLKFVHLNGFMLLGDVEGCGEISLSHICGEDGATFIQLIII